MLHVAAWLLILVAGLIIGIAALFSVYLFIAHRRFSHLPSPKGASFFRGHLPQLQRAEQAGSFFHYQLGEWSKEVGLVYVIWLAHVPMIILLDPEGIKEVSSRTVPRIHGFFDSLFGTRASPRSLIAISEYEDWKKNRRLYDPAFVKSTLKKQVPKFNKLAEDLVQTLRGVADGKTSFAIDLRDHYRNTTLHAISMVAFGSDYSQDPFVNSLLAPSGGLLATLDCILRGLEKVMRNPLLHYVRFGENAKYIDSMRRMRELGEYCIRSRIKALRNQEDVPSDLLTMILSSMDVQGNEGLQDMVDNFLLFFFAGQDTTAGLLSFATLELLKHPDILHRVLEEIDEVMGDRTEVQADDLDKLTYLTQVLEESLRLHSPGVGSARQAPSNGMTICGYYIPPNTKIMVSIFAVHRLPMNFDDPLTFDPGRFAPGKPRPSPYCYLPFGLSHRMCIGRVFAMIEAKIVLVRLLQTCTLTLPDDYTIRDGLDVTLHPIGGIPCTIMSRQIACSKHD